MRSIKNSLFIAYRYLVYHRIRTGILVTALAIILFVPLLLEMVVSESQKRLNARAESTIELPTTSLSEQSYLTPLLEGFLSFFFLVIILYLVVMMIRFLGKKEVFQLIIAAVILFALLYLLSLPVFAPSSDSQGNFFELNPPPPLEYPIVPLGQPPESLVWFLMIGVILVTAFLIFFMAKKHLRSNETDEKILVEVAHAISALRSGEGLRNVILRSYIQMTLALYEEQGIERDHTMTVREFETLLIRKGFPNKPVRQITTLFEKVRYSEELTNERDDAIALESLNEIIRFYKKTG